MRAHLFSRKITSAAAAMAIMLTSVGTFNAFAYDDDYDNEFIFSDTGITVSDSEGSGYKISGTDLTINSAGTYVVSGSCLEGTIKIKKGTTGVILVLEDLTLTSSEAAPISVNSGSEVKFVVEGTNTVTDAEDPANETSEDAEIADAFDGAAIKVKSGASAVFTGTGTLNVDGSECKNGIKGGATAAITVGENSADTLTLNVDAANNAFASDGSATINSGTVNLNAGGDGLKASPDDDDTESAGTITINGGAVNITSGEDGIQADGGFYMNGGSVDIVTANGYKYNKTIEAADISAKGIKADNTIIISDGTINIDSADDGIHLNGTNGNEALMIKDGDITVKAGDDGIHSDYFLAVFGGTINIEQACEGLEGAVIDLSGGTGTITASDDGINAANGDLTNYDFELLISGGSWYINAGGDGLDSNGDITVSGGYTEVFGSSDGGNAALDYGDNNCSFTVTGGTIVGIGMSQMATTPTSGNYIQFGASGGMGGGFGGMGGMGGPQSGQSSGSSISLKSGDTVDIKDSSGTTVYSSTAVKAADNIVFSSEGLDSSETYTLYINGTSTATATVLSGSQNQQGGQPGGDFPGGGFPGGDQPGMEMTYSVKLNAADEALAAETAVVTFSGNGITLTVQTDEYGNFSIPMGLRDGTYTVTASADGFVTREYSVTISRGQLTEDPEITLCLLGDADQNGSVGLTDISRIKRHLLNIDSLDDYALKCADANCDGSVNIIDISTLKKYLIGYGNLGE